MPAGIPHGNLDQIPEGLIRVHPTVDFAAPDPHSGETLKACDWSMPGMWTLARLESRNGGAGFWVDLPYSLAVLASTYLDAGSGEFFSEVTVPWYGILLQDRWRNRVDMPVDLRVIKKREPRIPVLLNCLYPWHGDAVSLLLRARPLAERGLDVIAIIGPSQQRLVPDYVAEAWVVHSKSDPSGWNEDVDRRIKQEVKRFDACYIPRCFKPCLLDQGELAGVTGITPFPREQWTDALLAKPVVTFILREDRNWSTSKRPLRERLIFPKRWRPRRDAMEMARTTHDQEQKIIQTAEALQKVSPGLEFAVIGMRGRSRFPAHIRDLRVDKINADVNRQWDEQCARSHVALAVHGSHTMPHNGFAGAFIEIVPPDKWANLLNTTFVTTRDPRETLFCYRFLPTSVTPREMAMIIQSILYNYASIRFAYHADYPDPISDAHYALIGQEQKKRFEAIKRCGPEIVTVLAP